MFALPLHHPSLAILAITSGWVKVESWPSPISNVFKPLLIPYYGVIEAMTTMASAFVFGLLTCQFIYVFIFD
jgi:hypothetical protein